MTLLVTIAITIASAVGPPASERPACTCAEAVRTNGRCEACEVGYIAGLRVASLMLHDVLDAHGHDVEIKSVSCPACKAAYEADGFCERCQLGYLKKRAYVSLLTYQLARGEPKDVARIACPVCKKNSETTGWCKACNQGMIGHVAVKDRKGFDRAEKMFRKLLEAVKLIPRCEMCAVAYYADGICLKCKVSYQDGRAIPEQKP